MNQDISAALKDQVRQAIAGRQPLAVIGGGSKHNVQPGHTRLDISAHAGIAGAVRGTRLGFAVVVAVAFTNC